MESMERAVWVHPYSWEAFLDQAPPDPQGLVLLGPLNLVEALSFLAHNHLGPLDPFLGP